MKKYRSIFLITPEPVKDFGDIRTFFIENSEHFYSFYYPLGYSKNYSKFEFYSKGKLKKQKTLDVYKGQNNIIKYLFYYAYFIYIVYFHLPKGTYIIDLTNPIFCFLSSLHKISKNIKFVYYIGDYFYKKTLLMLFYNFVVDYYNSHLDFILYESPPLESIYRSKLASKKDSAKIRKLVTLGIRKKFKKSKKIQKKIRLGFVGIIREKQGLDLVFSYLKRSKDVSLEIIGNGYKLNFYRELALEQGIESKIKFYGYLENELDVVKNWDIGLALYMNTKDNLSVYCEPTKIKNYLSYNLPVITTNVTYFGKQLMEMRAGEVINENVSSLSKAVIKVRRNYKKYKKGVNKILRKYEYSSKYEKDFSFIQENL